MSCRGLLTFFAILFFLSTTAPGFAAGPKYEPGELLVGYATSSDRDRAIKKFTGTKDALRVRGEQLEGVEAQSIAGNTVKLRLKFPARVLDAARNNPSQEIADLQEVAKQLKEADPSVQYAHPNWIAEVRTEPLSAAHPTPHQPHRGIVSARRTSGHKHARVASMKVSRHHHRAKHLAWWDYDLRWRFSFSSSCWGHASGRPKRHHSHWRCPRNAMR